MRVLHIVPGLEIGGTELFLAQLLPALRARGIESTLVSLRQKGIVAGRLEAAGITVHTLDLRGYASAVVGLPRLRALARISRPDVIHGWLYHGNLAASLAQAAMTNAHLVWSVRHSIVGPRHEKAATRLVMQLGAWRSRRVERIVFNAQEAAHQHAQAGFSEHNAVVIPNGIDTEKFKPDSASRLRNRSAHGFSNEDLVVGIAGRYHSIKGHGLFLKAAAIASTMNPRLRFVMLGRGLSDDNSELRTLVADSGIRDRLRLLGERRDIPDILNMMDVYVSASWGEGFPNVVGEAMACGVPCVATDVGASRELVGAAGTIVPPGSEQSLAAAIAQIAGQPPERRHALGAAARERISTLYSWERSVSAYVDMYAGLREGAR